MLDHLGLQVRDLAASCRFYEAALAPLGYMLTSRDASSATFEGQRGPTVYLSQASEATARVHVAFRVQTAALVDSFHAQALKAGGRDHGPPGLRQSYSPTYYAAFLLDPDGNNIEAVCDARSSA